MAEFTLNNLKTAGVGFRNNYQQGFDVYKSLWQEIASEVPSTTVANEYGWLGDFPGMREWIGERIVRQLANHDYRLKNRKFEMTIGFKLDDLADDNVGIYANRFQGMGDGAARHPDELIFEALELGFSSACYDGQNFFDDEHPVIDKEGETKGVSNLFTGSQTHAAFYLMDTSRALKPLVRQVRQKAEFTTKTDLSSDHVFNLDEVLYGVKSREAAGYGFWQMAAASTKELTAENFAEVYTAMGELEGDHGKKLTIDPNVLLVPPSLEDEAKMLMSSEKLDNGKRNPHKDKCRVIKCPWLSGAA